MLFFLFFSFFANSKNCLNILRDPRLRDEMLLHHEIFSFGDDFVKTKMQPKLTFVEAAFGTEPTIANTNYADHGRLFLENKNKILKNLKSQGTEFEVIEGNEIKILGGDSRLGRVAKQLMDKYGVTVVFHYDQADMFDSNGKYNIRGKYSEKKNFLRS